MSRDDDHPWWWTFDDIELSMIASHLAAGGPFCCEANADARRAVTNNKRKQAILEDHAYQGWGCYAGGPALSQPRGRGGARFAGEGPYLLSTGKEYSKKDTAYRRGIDLKQAKERFEGFLEDISQVRENPWTASVRKALELEASEVVN